MPRTRAPASVLTTLAVGAMVVGSTPTPTSAANTTRKVNAAAPGAKSKAAASTFKAEVWADNWFTMSVNGTKVGEDSVPITTERSFNAETFTFRASYPLTIAIETKDFKETDSGIEYIGKGQQQMGDGGLIAQITDTSTGKVVAVTNASWTTLVIHRAPLNPSCEKDPDPDATCRFESVAAPVNWTAASFDDGTWTKATVWSAGDVHPKDGYDKVSWNRSAKLVWGTDLKIDNTVLLRVKVGKNAPVT